MAVNWNLSIDERDYNSTTNYWKVLEQYFMELTDEWAIKIKYGIDDCVEFEKIWFIYLQFLTYVNTEHTPSIVLLPLLSEDFFTLRNEDGTPLYAEEPPILYYP